MERRPQTGEPCKISQGKREVREMQDVLKAAGTRVTQSAIKHRTALQSSPFLHLTQNSVVQMKHGDACLKAVRQTTPLLEQHSLLRRNKNRTVFGKISSHVWRKKVVHMIPKSP